MIVISSINMLKHNFIITIISVLYTNFTRATIELNKWFNLKYENKNSSSFI